MAPILPPLPPAVPGECVVRAGLACYVDGSGPPLLLVHTVNAAASAAEVRPLYEHYRRKRTVFALDLPGFGASDRSDHDYTPRLMTDALHAGLELARERCGDLPVDALGASLGCEFLARAAMERPQRFRRIALVSPTGLMGTKARRGPPGASRGLPTLHRILSQPLWAEAIYRSLTRPGVIRYFLERTWGGKAIDEDLWAYDVITARQPGARFAPLHFLAANLFSADIHAVYESLDHPIWASHGTRGDFTDYRGLPLVTGKGNWKVTVYEGGALPYFEHRATFLREMDTFLGAD
ncbi:MAG: alpha/beta fold hydrolase [Pseudomonadota bacterium]